jgi:hypothetical protein
MSASDAAPLPRLGEVFFDIRGSSRSMRLSWYADTEVAVFSIWQGGMCTGTFRLPIDDLPRMVETLRSGPGARASGSAGDLREAAEPWDAPEPERFDSRQTRLPAGYRDPQAPPGYPQDIPDGDYAGTMAAADYPMTVPAAEHRRAVPPGDYQRPRPDDGHHPRGAPGETYAGTVPAAGYPSAPEPGYLADQHSAYQHGGPAAAYPEGTAYPHDAPYAEGTAYPQGTAYPEATAYLGSSPYPDDSVPVRRRGDADGYFDAAGPGYPGDRPGGYADDDGYRGHAVTPDADSYPSAASPVDFPSVPSGRGSRHGRGATADDSRAHVHDSDIEDAGPYPRVPPEESFPYGLPPGNLSAPRQHGDARSPLR